MKKGRILALVVLTVVAALAMQSTASAVVFIYQSGPNVGQVYYGPVTFGITNYDTGTTYPALAPGASVGSTTPAVGYGILDSVVGSVPALNTFPATHSAGGNGQEDTWGIARVTIIEAPGGITVWSPTATDNLFVIFHGERDFHLTQGTGASLGTQFIDGTGLNVDVWETPTNTFDATAGIPSGSGGRTGATSYTGVTVGTLILSLTSRSSFINAAGVNGGLATEFESQFNTEHTNGNGLSYMDVSGGTQGAMFASGTFFTPVSLAAGVANADVFLNWDIQPNDLAGTDWLAKSHDPALANVQIPEPTTIIIWSMLGALGLAVGWRRRRA